MSDEKKLSDNILAVINDKDAEDFPIDGFCICRYNKTEAAYVFGFNPNKEGGITWQEFQE